MDGAFTRSVHFLLQLLKHGDGSKLLIHKNKCTFLIDIVNAQSLYSNKIGYATSLFESLSLIVYRNKAIFPFSVAYHPYHN